MSGDKACGRCYDLDCLTPPRIAIPHLLFAASSKESYKGGKIGKF